MGLERGVVVARLLRRLSSAVVTRLQMLLARLRALQMRLRALLLRMLALLVHQSVL